MSKNCGKLFSLFDETTPSEGFLVSNILRVLAPTVRRSHNSWYAMKKRNMHRGGRERRGPE